MPKAFDETFGTERRKIARGVFVDGIGQCGNGKQEGQTPEPPGGFQVGENNDGNQKISFSTNVCFNNGMGRFYFALIKPFHTFICKKMLKRVVRKLER